MDAEVIVPGSKSLTNRALVLAALATEPTRIDYPLDARDTRLMVAALRALGVRVDIEGISWLVQPSGSLGRAASGSAGGDAAAASGSADDGAPAGGGEDRVGAAVEVDCGLAGTVMRFVPPVAALSLARVRFDGDTHARNRPMTPLVLALRSLGVRVDDEGRGALPFTVVGRGRVGGGSVTLDASGSSQFVSALLLAGCRFDDGLTLRHDGAAVPSRPHIDMTLAGLRERGIAARELGASQWRVDPGVPAGGVAAMEPDLSNAAPFLAAALLTGGQVRIPGWPAHTTQPGHLLRDVLAAMGGEVAWDAHGLLVRGTGVVNGVDLDLGPAGELTPVLAALAATADSPSTFAGIAHLRGHETDRLAALRRELSNLGARVEEVADGLRIVPGPLRGGRFSTYEDHRMAQAGALLGLVVPGLQVENIATTAKTLPDFVAMWTGMLAGQRAAGAAPGPAGERVP